MCFPFLGRKATVPIGGDTWTFPASGHNLSSLDAVFNRVFGLGHERGAAPPDTTTRCARNQISPCRSAIDTAWLPFFAPSFTRRFRNRCLTAPSETPSRDAISLVR